MKNYTAIVRMERGGNVQHIVSEYETKEAFRKDLRSNGIRTLAIYTDEQLAKIKEKIYYEVHVIEEEYVRQVL
jgi:hypothetical protein